MAKEFGVSQSVISRWNERAFDELPRTKKSHQPFQAFKAKYEPVYDAGGKLQGYRLRDAFGGSQSDHRA